MNRPYRDVLDNAARPYVPDELDLFPRIAARLERKNLIQTLRARPALAILILLVTLSLLTGIAYAIGRSLGYIPGVGLVEQGADIRVLSEPVSLTREGITLTVEQAYLTPERTVLSFSVDGIRAPRAPKGRAVLPAIRLRRAWGCPMEQPYRSPAGKVLGGRQATATR